ncbi:MAG: SDR family NAD(P)-dependent oxidoreductase, partial [Luminiphilus sp.]|nr:SDR family NAD(P)-dependent oxidoreductase [Luminiphilus sp.]
FSSGRLVMRLENMKCVVTGGASGIGAATVRRFVREGADVCILDRDLVSAERLASECGGETFALELDVRQETAVRRAAERVLSRWGVIDVLVNNAGSELNKTYDETTIDEWDRVLDTDLKGPWLLCKYFVPSMVEQGAGSVINVSSLNGLVGFPLSTAYGSAKGGLVVFTKDMAIELATSGVRINCVCPGVIQTPMMERWTDLMPDKDEAKTMLRGVMPIGRMGTAEEVAGAILFFASEDSSLCQGAVLSVDGGFTAQ